MSVAVPLGRVCRKFVKIWPASVGSMVVQMRVAVWLERRGCLSGIVWNVSDRNTQGLGSVRSGSCCLSDLTFIAKRDEDGALGFVPVRTDSRFLRCSRKERGFRLK